MNKNELLKGWPQILAHRGACTLAPENTLEAFLKARELGCQGSEMDVHLCKTGELVITHDFYLDRVAGVHKKIQDTSLEELREYNMSEGFNAGKIPGGNVPGIDTPFQATKIPTLDELLETMGRDFYLDIEIKVSGAKIVKKLVHTLASTLDRHGHKNCMVSSFNPIAVLAYKKLKREPTSGIYCANTSVPWYLRHREINWMTGAPIQKPSIEIVRSDIIKNTRPADLFKKPTIIWTVDDPTEAQTLLDYGAACIITNKVQDFKY